jgi:hypothetical protein
MHSIRLSFDQKRIFLESNGIEIQFNLQKTKNYEVNNALYISKDNIIFGSNQGLLKVYNIEHKVSSIYDSVIQMKEYVNVRRKIIPYNENEVIFLGFPNRIFIISKQVITKRYQKK